MNQANMDTILKTMESMKQMELAVGEFYRLCGTVWPEKSALWNTLSGMEKDHAQNVEVMMQLIQSAPDNFFVGRQFSKAAVDTVVSGIRKDIERVRLRELTGKKLLFMARDIEESFLEKHFFDIVETQNVQYLRLKDKLTEDTFSHRSMLDREIRALATGA